MKSQVGLGILSIPTAFNALGMVPGVLVLCGIAGLTTWSDYVIGRFKLNHREVYSIDDAAALMFGPIGRWFLAVVFCLCRHPDTPTLTPTDLQRLYLCECFRNPRDIYWLECRVDTWSMHGDLCCHCGHPRVRYRECTDPRPNYLACMDRSSMCDYFRRVSSKCFRRTGKC